MLSIDIIQKRFRSQTRALHKELDSLPSLRVLVSADVNNQQYLTALSRLFKPHAYLESVVLDKLAVDEFDYALSPRTSYLKQDLVNLSGETHAFIPFQKKEALCDEAMIGFLYLLEGSKLGGVHILRNLRKSGLDSNVTHFFESSGDDKTSWESYWRFTQRLLETEEQLDAAASFAERAFCFYISHVKGEPSDEQLLCGHYS